jgi:hypothetical protein
LSIGSIFRIAALGSSVSTLVLGEHLRLLGADGHTRPGRDQHERADHRPISHHPQRAANIAQHYQCVVSGVSRTVSYWRV